MRNLRVILLLAATWPCAAPAADRLSREDEVFLNRLAWRSGQYFLQEMDRATGLVPDRADAFTNHPRASVPCTVAGGGFGLAALCIADQRGWIPHTDAVARARTMLRFMEEKAPREHGFFYHFMERDTGRRWDRTELSPIDTSLFLAGALTARQHFSDLEIRARVTRIYERVDWPWMLNGGDTFALLWKPETGFSRHRWHGYAEHMAMYLMAMGSPTHPIPPECWHAWRREPVGTYGGATFIMYPPLFVHQYAHAFVDFRGIADDYADYWQNSVLATLANRRMCVALRGRFPGYDEQVWGITASDSARGYRDWGGPPATPDLDGTVVPCAAGGSIPFAPRECIAALRTMHERYGDRIWGRYGFVDAFDASGSWTADDVLAIDVGILLVMLENHRSGLVWDRFMANPEIARAMTLARFRPAPRLAASTSLVNDRLTRAPARRAEPREAVASLLPRPEHQWDWRWLDAQNSRHSVFDGNNRIFLQFASGWDTNALHVRIVATDPEIADGDKVELYFDPEGDGFRWGDFRDFLFNFPVTSEPYESLNRPMGTSTVQRVERGYAISATIPWSLLGVEPRPGLRIHCSPGIYSVTDDDEPAAKLNWQWQDEGDAIRLGQIVLEGE